MGASEIVCSKENIIFKISEVKGLIYILGSRLLKRISLSGMRNTHINWRKNIFDTARDELHYKTNYILKPQENWFGKFWLQYWKWYRMTSHIFLLWWKRFSIINLFHVIFAMVKGVHWFWTEFVWQRCNVYSHLCLRRHVHWPAFVLALLFSGVTELCMYTGLRMYVRICTPACMDACVCSSIYTIPCYFFTL
jgi:hypothetical protein